MDVVSNNTNDRFTLELVGESRPNTQHASVVAPFQKKKKKLLVIASQLHHHRIPLESCTAYERIMVERVFDWSLQERAKV